MNNATTSDLHEAIKNWCAEMFPSRYEKSIREDSAIELGELFREHLEDVTSERDSYKNQLSQVRLQLTVSKRAEEKWFLENEKRETLAKSERMARRGARDRHSALRAKYHAMEDENALLRAEVKRLKQPTK